MIPNSRFEAQQREGVLPGPPEALDTRDLRFLLERVFDLPSILAAPLFRHHTDDDVWRMLNEAERLARDAFAPFAHLCDETEPTLQNGRVHVGGRVGESLRKFIDTGFWRAPFDREWGGDRVPALARTAIIGQFAAADMAAISYACLSMSAASMLQTWGTLAQKQRYLPDLIAGRTFATMCLSEPESGSSLADIDLSATPLQDNRFLLKGVKTWISAGDHDLSENILHFVLGRALDAPPGVKGISLFMAPRTLTAPGGAQNNGIRVARLNPKMGNKGYVNTYLEFGAAGDCEAELLGPERQGLRVMFDMMNDSRIAVGTAAAACAYGSFRYALKYARARRQGRSPGSSEIAAIVEHGDVQRLLMTQKTYAEGALALCLYGASLIDARDLCEDASERERLASTLELLTPVAKTWPSESGLRVNELAIQTIGGAGYARFHPLERLYRDNRINAIHEGTTGIQAIDLVCRKLPADGGDTYRSLAGRVRADIDAVPRSSEGLTPSIALGALWQSLDETVGRILNVRDPDAAIGMRANAPLFLEAFGVGIVGWLWLRQARAAEQVLAENSRADYAFCRGKIAACSFFAAREIPHAHNLLAIFSRAEPMEFSSAWL